ncbi:hypothetical protein NQP46_31870 [Streptomyces albus]|nr:hypothetical protein NQP46_31870 [Streptomyces albus]
MDDVGPVVGDGDAVRVQSHPHRGPVVHGGRAVPVHREQARQTVFSVECSHEK